MLPLIRRELGCSATVNHFLTAFVDRGADRRRRLVIDSLTCPVIDRYVVRPAVVLDPQVSPEFKTRGAVLSGGIVKSVMAFILQA